MVISRFWGWERGRGRGLLGRRSPAAPRKVAEPRTHEHPRARSTGKWLPIRAALCPLQPRIMGCLSVVRGCMCQRGPFTFGPAFSHALHRGRAGYPFPPFPFPPFSVPLLPFPPFPAFPFPFLPFPSLFPSPAFPFPPFPSLFPFPAFPFPPFPSLFPFPAFPLPLLPFPPLFPFPAFPFPLLPFPLFP